ncbi:MAG: SAM-dependent methyltransferase [Halobacteriales archaeon]|jgi:SAM-dependent methyltransferase
MGDQDRTDPRAFYNEYGQREWNRLDRDFFHRLEWEATINQLDGTLPDPGASTRVLDVGGGAGRYSIWLANRGYDVVLAEPSESQRDLARKKTADRGVADRVEIHAGDLRTLGYRKDAFDATCCLGGPLSHILDANGRWAATEELQRVTAPGSPVFVAVMGLLGMVLLSAQQAGSDDADSLRAMPDLVADPDYDAEFRRQHPLAPLMADTHFFRREEFVHLLERAGFTVSDVAGLEGVASPRGPDPDKLDDAARDAIRTVNDRLRTDPTMADISLHMLAVCRA